MTIFCCNCNNSIFGNKNHGHIATVDLQIIKSNKLRKYICKKPKYNESTSINFHDAKEDAKYHLQYWWKHRKLV